MISVPVPEAADAFSQVTPGLKFWIDENLDVYFGQLLGDAIAQVKSKLVAITKGVFAALSRELADCFTARG